MTMKWVFLGFAIFLALGSGNSGTGGVSGGLFICFTLIHLYDRWRKDTGSSNTPDHGADNGTKTESPGPENGPVN